MCDTNKQTPPPYETFPQPYQQTENQTAPQTYVPAQVYNIPATSIPTCPVVQQAQVYHISATSVPTPTYPAAQQTQVYNIPATSVPTYPAVQPVAQNEGWWNRNQKNKPQSNSAGAASLIFVSGGMNMAWKLGFSYIPSTNYILTDHIICSWFVGGIIGVAIGAFTCNRISKRTVVGIASVLVAVCGILQVSDSDSYEAILASRYLNGIAVGLVFPLTFVLLSEEVVKPLRGMNAASVDTMCFSCGIFIEIMYNSSWSYSPDDSFQPVQLSGTLNIVYGVVSFIIGYLFLIESPIYYLAQGNEQMSVDSLRRLQKPFTVTYETYEQLEEHKRYLAESKERNLQQNAVYGIPALIKLCFYRAFMALGFSCYVNFAFVYSTAITGNQTYPYILYALARLLGPLITAFTLDSRGRKSPMIFGFFICTILAFAVGGIFDDKLNYIDYDSQNAIQHILILFQLFASISMASSSAYLSEAFPLAVKPYYVAIVFTVEMLVQIIIICNKDVFRISDYFFSLGALSLVFLGVAIFVMPETKCCSLRECLPKFKQNNNYRN